ncbi:unnamed protein product [Linum trigynum]|uniref:Uncharacterized protein n=1 Tax=Linum trigynum TaxID=586398 RepID=A0AAV2FTW1_9ROSI
MIPIASNSAPVRRSDVLAEGESQQANRDALIPSPNTTSGWIWVWHRLGKEMEMVTVRGGGASEWRYRFGF